MQSVPTIVYKDENVVVIIKPIGMPSQSDPTGDIDAMTATSELLLSLGERDSLWLVHRLDRNVSGLLAFARNKKSAAELSKIIQNGIFSKKYIAVCHGEADEGEYRDFLYKDSATSKAYVVKTERKGAKEARLDLVRLGVCDEKSLVHVTLDTGRFHQIRAQLSSRGLPIYGDGKYGSREKAPHFALWASKLSFAYKGKKYEFKKEPDFDTIPWNMFS